MIDASSTFTIMLSTNTGTDILISQIYDNIILNHNINVDFTILLFP